MISNQEYEANTQYDDGDGGKKHFGSLRDMVQKYYLREQHFELKKYCEEIGLDFCSSPFSCNEVDLLEKLDVPFYKIASMDINNFNLLRYVSKKNKPIVISTGMSTLSEIKNAVSIIESEGNNRIILLHCISIYPPDHKDINLNNIKMLKKLLNIL